MADVSEKPNEENWEYEDEEAEDYEWEYETEEEEAAAGDEEEEEDEDAEKESEVPLDEQELPDPFSPVVAATTKTTNAHGGANGHQDNNGEDKKKHHKKHHKKSRHLERIELFKEKEKGGDEYRNKKIHVRSKDPSRIARQFEKAEKKSSKLSMSSSSKNGGKKVVAPPPQKINQICKVCNKEPYLVERVVAEKSWWHKNCFRCKQCNKILTLDTYMSHEGVLYCKPHHKELFQPKVVKGDIIDVEHVTKTQEAILRHQEQQRKMETIVRESNPVDLGDSVVKCSTYDKFAGLENLDVGSKYKMFESASNEQADRGPSSDRYGIMEKLKRLQEGADLDELLAEMDEELPSDENEEEYDEEDAYLTEVQKKSKHAEKLFSEDVKKARKDESTRRELQALRKRLNCGGTSNAIEAFDDLLNASSHKVQKTKVDVRSENAKKFREMFDKGEVPEAEKAEKQLSEKDAELEMMRKSRRQQRDFFKLMEAGKLDQDDKGPKEPKLLVGKLKEKTKGEANGEEIPEELPELASLSHRFSYFEHFNEQDGKDRKKKSEADEQHEADLARRECKAKSVLNKFKEMENRVLNGEEDVPPAQDPDKPIFTALGFLGKLPGVEDRRRPLKRFTPPRKLGSDSDSGSEYSDSEYSESSYTSGYSRSTSDSEEEEDETLKAIRSAQRAKELRAKFEEWEQSQDAKDQMAQMAAYDENGEPLETAGILRRKFEALRMHEEMANQRPTPLKAEFRPKRFK